jgi:hypothetical protein
MASLVLGVVGAFVGFWIGGPVGASIGWSLGSLVGGALNPPPGSSGPRLSDLRLQGSTYGSFIGIVYGTDRVAGDVIWATDLVEHEHTSGGKGGGGESTSYSYTASYAIQICEGPIAGIFKAWKFGRLVYSVDDDGTIHGDLPITVYLGTETQLPDPTIEAVEGVGNVSANRGTAYVVFTDDDLSDSNNAIPAWTFLVSTGAGDVPFRVSTYTRQTGHTIRSGIELNEDGTTTSVLLNWQPSANPTERITEVRDIDGTLISTETDIVGTWNGLGVFSASQCDNNTAVSEITASSGGGGDFGAWYRNAILVNRPINGGTSSAVVYDRMVYLDDYVFAIGGNNIPFIGRYPSPNNVTSKSVTVSYTLDPSSTSRNWVMCVSDDGYIYVADTDSNGHMVKLDTDLNVVRTWGTAGPLRTAYNFVIYQGQICHLYTDGGGAHFARLETINDDDTFTLVGEVAIGVGDLIAIGTGGLVSVGDGVISLNPPPSGMLLSEVVQDISCGSTTSSPRCGLTTSQVNVTALTDVVEGFKIGSQMTGRAAIEALMPVYFFDAVESDNKVKFVRRGGESVATITEDELAATADGASQLPAQLETVRGADAELPASVTIVYPNPAADYQNGTQTQRRQTGGSQSPMTLEMAVVMSDSKAKQVVDALTFHPFLERNRRTFWTSRKYLALEPTDVVTVMGIELRITQKSEGADGVLRFDALPALSSIYSQPSVPGTASGFPTQTVARSQTTQSQILDIPLVSDTDNEGCYVAAAGAISSSWRGYALFRSSDGGSSYTEIARTTRPDIIGEASTVLGNFLDGDVFDETNTVTVVVGPGGGTLSSSTTLGVLNGANKALLGSEILQYRDATLTGADTYLLAGLLRGRRGTEWAMGTHGPNERFIALPTAINLSLAELNVTRLYKAVTLGSTLATATAVEFANTGVAVRPYSPVQIGGGFNVSGDCVISWVRRTRIGGEWVSYVDVPLSESSELYTVEIWDSTYTTIKRTISGLTSATTTYTAAQQTTDFGSPQTNVYAKIYQVGRFLPSRGVRARFPGNTVTWTSDLEPTPGAIPPIAALRTIPLTWATPGTLQAYSSDYGGFAPGDSISISFTTPAGTSSDNGFVGMVEFGDPTTPRVACLSTVSGDFDTGLAGQPSTKQESVGPRFYFTVGVTVAPYIRLNSSTTYYMNLRNGVTNATSCNIQITLKKPSGL